MHARSLSGRRIRRSAVAVLAAGATVAGISLTTAQTASAAGPMPSTTTLAASGYFISTNQTESLTASVKVLGLPGLVVTPLGTVRFTIQGGGTLATVPVGGFTCLLKTCTANVTTTVTLPAGKYTIVATFSGDLLAKSSSGKTNVNVFDADAQTQQSCPARQVCTTDYIDASEGDQGWGPIDTAVVVSAAGSAKSQTVDASLVNEGNPFNPCDGVFNDVYFGTESVLWSTTAGDATKTLTVAYGSDPAVDADSEAGTDPLNYLLSDWQDNGYFGCFEAAFPFKGAVVQQIPNCTGEGCTTVGYGNAPLVNDPTEGSYYAAPLFDCSHAGVTPPCIKDVKPDIDSDGNVTCLEIVLSVPANLADPKWLP